MKVLRDADAEFRRLFGVRLGVVIVDTVSASCPMDNENSNAEIAVVCSELRQISHDTDTVLVGVHHFGKNQESGLRGGAAWRANCDHSRIFLADRDGLGGAISNRRVVLEKNRLGPEGDTVGFELQSMPFGVDQWGDDITEGYILPCNVKRSAKTKNEPECVRRFRAAYSAAFSAYRDRDGAAPNPLAVPLADVREEFNRAWATGEEKLSAKEANTRKNAWHRAETKVRGATYEFEVVDREEWVWPT